MATENMTLDDFKSTSEFLALNENQKIWILKLIATKDARQSTIETYPKARKLGSAYTSQLAGKLLSSAHVRDALSVYYGWDNRQKFLADLEANIRKAKGADKVSLLALKARMLGLTNDATLPAAIDAGTFDADQQTFPIGATIEQDHKKYVVTAVEIG